jgi:fermentation-respiration switch protein FrsA (DUF1100 family)
LQVSSRERAVNKARAAVRKAPAAGVPNELVTIKGGGHGQFTNAELEDAYQKIRAFLHSHGLLQ